MTPSVSIRASRSSFALGGSATLSTTVGPNHKGRAISLQRWTGTAWSTVATSHLVEHQHGLGIGQADQAGHELVPMGAAVPHRPRHRGQRDPEALGLLRCDGWDPGGLDLVDGRCSLRCAGVGARGTAPFSPPQRAVTSAAHPRATSVAPRSRPQGCPSGTVKRACQRPERIRLTCPNRRRGDLASFMHRIVRRNLSLRVLQLTVG